MAINYQEFYNFIREQFPDAVIELIDQHNNGDYYFLKIGDPSFKNIKLIEQHKLVKNKLSPILKNKLHSLQLKTYII